MFAFIRRRLLASAFFRRLFGFPPTDVEGALGSIFKGMGHLRAVSDAKAFEADCHADAISVARDAHAAAIAQVERADRVSDAIAKLIA